MNDRATFMALLDTEQLHDSDAIILLEGDGTARYRKAVELYKKGVSPVICFSGNFDDEKSGAYTFEKILPLIIAEGVPIEAIIFEDKSKNTYEQAVEIMKIAKKKGWKRITMVVSHYHTYRAFLTFLHEQKVSCPELIIDMASVDDLDWYEETGYGRRIDLLLSEMHKIEIYHSKGNVSTYKEGIDYLEWKYHKQKQ